MERGDQRNSPELQTRRKQRPTENPQDSVIVLFMPNQEMSLQFSLLKSLFQEKKALKVEVTKLIQKMKNIYIDLKVSSQIWLGMWE